MTYAKGHQEGAATLLAQLRTRRIKQATQHLYFPLPNHPSLNHPATLPSPFQCRYLKQVGGQLCFHPLHFSNNESKYTLETSTTIQKHIKQLVISQPFLSHTDSTIFNYLQNWGYCTHYPTFLCFSHHTFWASFNSTKSSITEGQSACYLIFFQYKTEPNQHLSSCILIYGCFYFFGSYNSGVAGQKISVFEIFIDICQIAFQ